MIWDKLRSLIRWEGAVLGILMAFLCGWVFSSYGVATSSQSLLLTLITAQASILAIVVSVTLLSTQLVATNYAPRMSTLLLRTDQFKRTVGIFIMSISLDILLYLGLEQVHHPLLSGLFYSAIILFGLVLVSVYLFSIEMVAQSIPERLVELFTRTVSIEEYIEKVKQYSVRPESNTHPLHPLFRYTMTALSKGEYSAASSALDHYLTYTTDILTEVKDRELLKDSDFEGTKQLFGPVLKDHLHLIAQHAAENDESQIRKTAIQGQVDLGKQGIALPSHSRVFQQAMKGVEKTIRDAPYTEKGYPTLNQCWKAVGELAEECSETGESKHMLSVRSTVEQWLGHSVRNVEEPGWLGDSSRTLFDKLCKAHLNTLQVIGEKENLDELGPSDLYGDGTKTPADTLQQLRYCQQAIYEFTSVFLKFRIEKGEWIPTEGNFTRTWQQLVIKTAETGATDLAVELCEVLIQMAFIENTAEIPSVERPSSQWFEPVDPNAVTHWKNELEKIEKNTDSPVVSQAFSNLLSYESLDSPVGILVRSNNEKSEQQELYRFDFNIPEYSELNTREEYPDALIQLKNQILDTEQDEQCE